MGGGGRGYCESRGQGCDQGVMLGEASRAGLSGITITGSTRTAVNISAFPSIHRELSAWTDNL